MRHRPTGPPLSLRVAGALGRGAARGRHSARRPPGRVALGTALLTTVIGLVLAVPMVSSGSGTPPMALDSSSSGAARYPDESPPVRLSEDGTSAAPPQAVDVPAGSEVAPAELPATAPDAAPAAPDTGTDVPVAATAPAPAPLAAAAAPGAVSPGAEADVLASVNAARAGSGCAPLVHDEGLATVARAHSADMRDRGFFDHVNPSGLDPFDRAEAAGQTNMRAENLASGQPSATAVMDFWMGSSSHRANILDCSLRTLGVGVAAGPAGPWWTQLFGD